MRTNLCIIVFDRSGVRALRFKPIIAAIGLTTGAIDPDEDYGNEGLSWQKDCLMGILLCNDASCFMKPVYFLKKLAILILLRIIFNFCKGGIKNWGKRYGKIH